MTSKYNTYRLKFGTQGFKLKNLLHFILEKFVLPIGEIIEEAVSEELREEPEGSEFREEEEALSINSTSTNHPVTGIHSAFQCPSPTPQVKDRVHTLSSSNHPHQQIGQQFSSTPVSGAKNSSTSHQIPSTALCASMPPPSRETVTSFNLPGHLSGHSHHSTGSMSRDCTSNWEKLDSRLQQLEKKVECLMEIQQQKPTPFKAPLSVQNSEHVGKGKKDSCFYGKLFILFYYNLGERVERWFLLVCFFPFSRLFCRKGC